MADSIEVLAALDEMHEATAGLKDEELRSALRTFVNGLSVEATGNVTVLWSGYYDVADGIA